MAANLAGMSPAMKVRSMLISIRITAPAQGRMERRLYMPVRCWTMAFIGMLRTRVSP